MPTIATPYAIDGRGRTALVADEEALRDMIAAVLFTSPGERLNRPSFGSSLQQLVFAPNSPELAATTQFLIQGALQQWMGDLIAVDDIEVTCDDATLHVRLAWTVRRTQEKRIADFVNTLA